MPLILSVETSGKVCSLALHKDGVLVGDVLKTKERSHAELLPSLIDDLFEGSPLDISGLNAIAISAGPGSYTGLRIGTAIVKGLCFGRELPLVEISTLAVVGASVSGSLKNQPYLAALKARQGEVFALLINGQNEGAPGAYSLNDDKFKTLVFDNNIRTVVGDDLNDIVEAYPELKVHQGYAPLAKNMGQLAYKLFQEKEFVDVIHFEPQYLKEYYFKTKSKV